MRESAGGSSRALAPEVSSSAVSRVRSSATRRAVITPSNNIRAWPTNMLFNCGAIAADQTIEIHIFFVSGDEQDAAQFAKSLLDTCYRISVTWVRADCRSIGEIASTVSAKPSWTPTAIIIDYSSYGRDSWDVIRSVRRAIGERYVEYVIFDVPNEDRERFDARAANLTIVPLRSRFGDCGPSVRTLA